MPNTDFFDDDLIRQRDAPKRIKMGPADDAVESLGEGMSPDEAPARAVGVADPALLQQRGEEPLDEVLGAVPVRAAAAGVGVERVPVRAAERLEGFS